MYHLFPSSRSLFVGDVLWELSLLHLIKDIFPSFCSLRPSFSLEKQDFYCMVMTINSLKSSDNIKQSPIMANVSFTILFNGAGETETKNSQKKSDSQALSQFCFSVKSASTPHALTL